MDKQVYLNLPMKFYGETHRRIVEAANLLIMVDNMEAQGVSSSAVVLLDEVGEKLVECAKMLDHTDNSLYALRSLLPGARQYLSIKHQGKEVDVKLPHTVIPRYCIFCSSSIIESQKTLIAENGYDTHIHTYRCSCGAEYNHCEDLTDNETP
jgi:hypothetical protein